MVAILKFSVVDVNIAQVILESAIIAALVLQPAKSAYMNRFVNMLIITLCIETSLILALTGLLILLFFGGSTYFLQSLRLSITMIQYFKIYLLISLLASFRTV